MMASTMTEEQGLGHASSCWFGLWATRVTPVIFWALLALTLAVGIGRFSAADSANPQDATPAAVMQDELREALDRDELVLHYQPTMELGTGRVSSLEALVRWQHPQRGLLMPSEFLPVAAQHSELMGSLTSWVLRRALADYKAWTAVGRDWTVAVNISAADLGSLEFAGSVGQILAEAGIRPDRLHIEVAETELAFDTDLARQVVGALTAQGILMSIDDFGIGYTSLSQLRTLQVSEVKIDRTFLAALPGNEQDRAKVHSLIDLGHSLGCSVTAEGVEWQDVADWLVDAGCDHAQGYLWLRPRSWTEVAQVFDATTATTPTTAYGAAATGSAPAQAGRMSASR
jgi:diguanylate cyclase